jgi:hypothetical protein
MSKTIDRLEKLFSTLPAKDKADPEIKKIRAEYMREKARVITLDKRASVTVDPAGSNNQAVRDLRDACMQDPEAMAAHARELSRMTGKDLATCQIISRRFLAGDEKVSPLSPEDRDHAERAAASLRDRR